MKKFNVTIANANELAAVELISASLVKGQTATITMIDTDSANFMNKGGRAGVPVNPFYGGIMKITTFKGWQVGTNYNNSCKNSAVRSGSTETFVGGNSWHTYYNDFFEVDKKTGTKFYLQAQMTDTMSSRIETKYYYHGIEVEKSKLAQWLKKTDFVQPATQIEAGISREQARQYNVITLAKIHKIVQGEFVWNVCKESEAAAEAAAK